MKHPLLTGCPSCERLSYAALAIYGKIFGVLHVGNLDDMSGGIPLLISHRIVLQARLNHVLSEIPLLVSQRIALQVNQGVPSHLSLPITIELGFLGLVFMLLVQSSGYILCYISPKLYSSSVKSTNYDSLPKQAWILTPMLLLLAAVSQEYWRYTSMLNCELDIDKTLT